MTNWQARVHAERDELQAKVKKLTAFIADGSGPFFDLIHHEKQRLTDQLHHMTEYLRILEERIANFNKESK